MTEQTQVCPAGRPLSYTADGKPYHADVIGSPCHADARCFKDFACGLKRAIWRPVLGGGKQTVATHTVDGSICHGLACPEKLLAEDVGERRIDVATAEWRTGDPIIMDRRHRNIGPPKAQQRVPGKGERRQGMEAIEGSMFVLHLGEAEDFVGKNRRIATEPRRQAEREPVQETARHAVYRHVKYLDCDCEAHGHNVASFCPMHGNPISDYSEEKLNLMQQGDGHPEEQPVASLGSPGQYLKWFDPDKPTADYQVEVGQPDLPARLRFAWRDFRQQGCPWPGKLINEAAEAIEALTKRAEDAEEGKRVAEKLVRRMAREASYSTTWGVTKCVYCNERWDEPHGHSCPITKAREAGILEDEK